MREKPKQIYRFRPLDNSLFERELLALTDSFLWSPRFDQMNDPMEAFYEFDRSIDPIFETLAPKLSPSLADLYSQFENMLDGMCLVSFSTTHQFFPMWAYYASNFAGMCLEFDSEQLEIGDFRNEPLLEVSYEENPTPPISLFSLDKLSVEEAGRFLSVKHSDWQHEREWRYITGSGGRRNYLDTALRRVYLGPRVLPEHRDHILNALKTRPVQVLQGHVRKFELVFNVIQDARPLSSCERVGAGKFDPETVLSYAERDLRTLLGPNYDELLEECKRTVEHPNTEAIVSIDIAGSDPSTLYFWTLYKLRSGREVNDKRYFDSEMKLMKRVLAKA
jgi:Protein of unknown function (DUF2971)